MNHTPRMAQVFSLLTLCAPRSFAQTASTVPPQSAATLTRSQGTCSVTLSPLRPATVSGPVAPYSAVEESSNVQTLADGTHITQKPWSQKIYCDSQGRIRTERSFCYGAADDPDMLHIEIRDPVVGYSYILDSRN